MSSLRLWSVSSPINLRRPINWRVNCAHSAIQYVLIAARGTSDNAARYAQYVLGAYNHIQVALATPSLYTLYGTPPDLRGALVVGISQSGQSPDIVSVLTAGRAQGRPTLAITNVPDSPLAQAADWVLPLDCGVERAVAATKTYTTSLAALALLSTALSGNDQHRAELAQVPEWMRQTLRSVEPQLPHVERYRYVGRSAVIGRGFNYATAFEVALKIKELIARRDRVVFVGGFSARADLGAGDRLSIDRGRAQWPNAE